MMRRLALLVILAVPAYAQDRTPDPPWVQQRAPEAQPVQAQNAAQPLLLRLAVSPEGPVWVGQRVTVTLTAMTPVRFVDPLAWPDLAPSQGRAIVLPEAATVPGTERVGGQSYAALQRSYSLFPADAGTLALAPLHMTARVGGPDGQPLEASAATAETRVTARVPDGVADVTRLVVAPSFRLTAGTEGEATQVHVGEAVVRTLRMEADDSAAMLLPPAVWTAPEGVRVYPDPPAMQDRSDRGALHALRSERAAFVPQRPGPVELPGFAVSWLDPRNGRLQQVTVPALRFDVLPAGTAAAERRRPAWIWAAVVLAGVLVGALIWWATRRRTPRAAATIAALARACRAGDARGAIAALYRWTEALLPPGDERTVAHLAGLAGVPTLAEAAAALEAQLYGGPASGAWSGAALLDAARETERVLRRQTPSPRTAALPALNPAGTAAPPPRLTQPRWAR